MYCRVLRALMMEGARTSETSADIKLRTRQYFPEDSELHTRRRENLKSHIYDGVPRVRLPPMKSSTTPYFEKHCVRRRDRSVQSLFLQSTAQKSTQTNIMPGVGFEPRVVVVERPGTVCRATASAEFMSVTHIYAFLNAVSSLAGCLLQNA
jgi:hypothetical protein